MFSTSFSGEFLFTVWLLRLYAIGVMKLEGIFGKELTVTPEMEEYVMKRIRKLAKIVQKQQPATIRVDLGEQVSHRKKKGGDFYAEFHVIVQEKAFRVRKSDINVFRAVERVRVDMHQKIVKWKKMERDALRKKERAAKRALRLMH
jgi:ribosomal subunit interface protein